MSSPDDLPTVLVRGQYFLSNGEPATGLLTFKPSHQLLHRGGQYLIAPAPRMAYLDALGRFSIRLFATDEPELKPVGWTWQVTQQINLSDPITWNLQLPAALGSADITSLATG